MYVKKIRPLLIVVLVGALVTALLMVVGCFGGEDEGSGSTDTTGSGGPVDTVSEETTTLVAVVDPLSSFKSKDPFIPQAQVTTTTAAPTTTGFTTTTAGVTTTLPHTLRVTAFPGGGTVSFTIDSVTFTGITPSTGLFIGGWGTIQLMSVNDTVAPYSAAFKRASSIDFTLYLNQSRTW
jgi:hypothetical protein